jgi:iron(III) transport system ATP-binding protein
MASIELRKLSKRFDGKPAVDAVDLVVDDGTMVCLLGPSGCGKTTTLRLVAGFMEPTGGEVMVGGRVLSSPDRTLPPEQRNMSMIFQSYALWPHMTVTENVAYGLALRKLGKEEIRRRVADILVVTRLGELAERYPSELSGGQQQRVALARALVVEPQTLLLDEPLSNLDANLREEMRFELRRLHDRFRTTTLYVTHDQSEAMTTSDVIVVMNLGRIEQVGTPEEIYREPRSEFVARFIGGANILKGKALGGGAVECGGIRVEYGRGTPSGGAETSVSIRLHDIRLFTAAPAGIDRNLASGRVARQVFLGAARDYLVELPGGEQLRVTAPPELDIAPGSPVWVHLPPEHCRALVA